MWEIDSIRLVRLSKLLTDPACFALSSHQTRYSLDSNIKLCKIFQMIRQEQVQFPFSYMAGNAKSSSTCLKKK